MFHLFMAKPEDTTDAAVATGASGASQGPTPTERPPGALKGPQGSTPRRAFSCRPLRVILEIFGSSGVLFDSAADDKGISKMLQKLMPFGENHTHYGCNYDM